MTIKFKGDSVEWNIKSIKELDKETIEIYYNEDNYNRIKKTDVEWVKVY